MSINNLMSNNPASYMAESRYARTFGERAGQAESSGMNNSSFDPVDSVDISSWNQVSGDEGSAQEYSSPASSGSGSDDWEAVLARTLAKHGAPKSVYDEQVNSYRNLKNDMNKPDDNIHCVFSDPVSKGGAKNQDDNDNIHCVFSDPVSTGGVNRKDDDDNIHCVFSDPVSTGGVNKKDDDDNIHCVFSDPVSTGGADDSDFDTAGTADSDLQATKQYAASQDSSDWDAVLARTLAKHGASKSVFDDQSKGYRQMMNDINTPDEPIRCTAGMGIQSSSLSPVRSGSDDDNIHCKFMDPIPAQ
ncbi:MAG: hypothetical protein AB9903_01000 [Vulcanimicrobiota bacterium]